MKKQLQYYFWSSYRRKNLDNLQEKYKYNYKGIVLDIGGRDRGKFEKPKDKVEKWIFADIEKIHKPDMMLDVANMKTVKTTSIDVINAIELFEHVEKIDKGLDECYRILNKNGKIIISMPFLYKIHGDPFDFQRWTQTKWEKELNERNFKIETLEITGLFFTTISQMLKDLINSLPKIVGLPLKISYPILDLLVSLDNTKLVKNNKVLNKFHDGYFIIAKKK